MSSFPREHKSPVDLGYGNFGYASILYIKKAFYTCLLPPTLSLGSGFVFELKIFFLLFDK
jgi:hypothetical protein